MRLPHGPTLTYKIKEYALSSDISAVQSRPSTTQSMEFMHPPLVVLSNFSAPSGASEASHRHVKLAGVMFQNLFPTLDVNSVQLRDCRRVVLTNFEPGSDGGTIEWRHYSITMRERGLSSGVRRLTEPNAAMPDLSKLNDISELLEGGAGDASSDSEGEGETTVTMERRARRQAKRRRKPASSGPPQQVSWPQHFLALHLPMTDMWICVLCR